MRRQNLHFCKAVKYSSKGVLAFSSLGDRRMGFLIEMGKSNSVPTMARHGYGHFYVTYSKQQREMKEHVCICTLRSSIDFAQALLSVTLLSLLPLPFHVGVAVLGGKGLWVEICGAE
jgi:hypothetical protein